MLTFSIKSQFGSSCISMRGCFLFQTSFILILPLTMTSWATTFVLLVILMRNFRVDSIRCHITEYNIGEECCPMCSAGYRVKTDCNEFKSTTCQRCSDGTYVDLPNGLKKCNPCSTCDSGAGLKVKQQCKLTADTVCEPMEGFYCTDLKSGGCSVAQKHRSCEPGHYISRMGTASTDTECSECSSGSFSDGTMLSCQPHTQCEKENLQLIKAGTASTDAECGEKSSNTTGIVIGVLFLVIFLLVAAALIVVVVVLRKNKKIKIPNIFTKQQKPQRDQAEEEEQGDYLNVQDNKHTDGDKLLASTHSFPGTV